MKRLLICLTVVVCLLGFSGVAFGNSGSAIIPSISWVYVDSSNYVIPYISVSNLTNASITITITIYNPNGTILTGGFYPCDSQIPIEKNFTTTVSGASVSFTLDAYNTGAIYLSKNGSGALYGYGRVVWSNNDPNTANGVVAYITNAVRINNIYSETKIPINNGLPF